ncbi:MAG: UvrD-helicase domain-containing protein [Planctomycetota bacterium]
MDPILDDLNEAQRDAVTHGEGPMMVVAGAGSGKTRVITRRIAHLLREGVPAHQVLALTFTNKAAGEMARRVEQLGGGRVLVSTFHSACARFLRQHADRIGFPSDFSIYDTQDRDSAIKYLMQEHRISKDDVKPSAVGRRISQLKNLGEKPGEVILGMTAADRAVEKLFGPYQDFLQQLGAMDFDDLLGRFLDLLIDWPDVAEAYQERFRYILVDEFQDTNRVQYDLLKRMVGEPFNFCVVGDPDQSIYRFRGAELRNILDFEDDYEGTKVVRLETNYRSTQRILQAAEGVIVHNQDRLEKHLVTDNDEGAPLVIDRCYGPAQEARNVVEHILALLDDGVSASEIAIFFRSHHISRGIEEGLRNQAMPYRIVGGLSFFERREIKDLVAYMRVLVNPIDDVAMERVINVPARGVGRVSLDKLRGFARDAGLSLCEAVCDPGIRQSLSGKARTGLAALADVITKARARIREGAHPALMTLVEGLGYADYIGGSGDPEDEVRRENVAELHNDAAFFDSEVGGGLSGYLQHIALLTSDDRNREDMGPRISVMTVHASKGLEFDHVFVTGLEEGLFPNQRALEEPGGLEEERRLMYVALTRARKTLHLSWSQQRMVNGRLGDQTKSSFLREIPKEVLALDDDRDFDSDDDHGDFSGSGFRSRRTRGDLYEESQDLSSEFGGDSQVDFYADEDQSAEFVLGEGTRVVHQAYGQGTVLRLSGSGQLQKITVRFDRSGERTLITEYAGLRIVPGGAADASDDSVPF